MSKEETKEEPKDLVEVLKEYNNPTPFECFSDPVIFNELMKSIGAGKEA